MSWSKACSRVISACGSKQRQGQVVDNQILDVGFRVLGFRGLVSMV